MIEATVPAIGTRHFALRETSLAPGMLLPRRGAGKKPFVLEHPDARFHYLGRNASHALIRGLGITGGELLFPAFFGGPVLQAPLDAGASVRFYPVRADLSVRIGDIAAALTPETRAIYLIHFNGFPGPIDEVMELARERDLLVIEDCAHAMLSTLGRRPLGSIGDGAIFSFYKWVPVPNGAALVTNRMPPLPPERGLRASWTSGMALSTFSLLNHLALHHGERGEWVRSTVRAVGRRLARATSLAYVSTGGVEFHADQLDYAMSPISHRILNAQDWREVRHRRRRNYTLLADLLSDIAPPIQGDLPDGIVPLFYPIAVENKRSVLLRLSARGIEGRNFWELHHELLPPGVFPETDELRRTTLELPIHQDLSTEDIRRIAMAMRVVLGKRAASPTTSLAAD
jgi:dTDP-4-amino-4,6-dideoxygalactose transaminase